MAYRILPPAAELQKMLDAGMTHQEIADEIAKRTGEPVARSTVSAAISRAGLSGTMPRYREVIPWKVKVGHLNEYPARMLRLYGRRRDGYSLTDEEAKRLESWLLMLDSENAVVGYDPDNEEQGFHYVLSQTGDGYMDIPIIRRPRIRTTAS